MSKSGPPILKRQPVSRFDHVFTFGVDDVWEPKPVGSVFAPRTPDGYFTVGHFAQAGTPPASGSITVLGVDNDEPENPLLKEPVDYVLFCCHPALATAGENKKRHVLWQPVPPDGYVALGHLGTTHLQNVDPPPKPALNAVRCLRDDYAQRASSRARLFQYTLAWRGDGSQYRQFTMVRLDRTGAMCAVDSNGAIELYEPRE